MRLAFIIAIIASVTFVCFKIFPVNATTVSAIFLLAILAIAARFGLVESVVASVAAMFCFNFYFLPPIGTLTISDPQNWVALFAFLITSIIASQLSAQARQRAEEASARQREMERLYELSRALMLSSQAENACGELTRLISRIFECDPVAFYDRQLHRVFRAGIRESEIPEARLKESALQGTVFRDAETHLITTPVSLGGQSAGSLCVPDGAMSDAALNAVVNLAAIAIERENAQNAANRAEAARRGEELKSTLLDAVAHEFKTPLTSIKAATTAMLSDAKPESQEYELLTIVNEETDRLNEMVSEAIQTAAVDAGKVQLDKQPVSLAPLIESLVKQSANFLEDRSVSVDIPGDLPTANLDRELITLVLRQLLTNAAKYSPLGSPIAIGASVQDGNVLLLIGDRGEGIPEAEQQLIFDKYYRARGVRGRISGTGMGLSIAREIIKAHRGRLWVESQPGEGSRFSVLLPIGGQGQKRP